jgi:hypothetical protein
MNALTEHLKENADLIKEHSQWQAALFSSIAALAAKPSSPNIQQDIENLSALGCYLSDKVWGLGAGIVDSPAAAAR